MAMSTNQGLEVKTNGRTDRPPACLPACLYGEMERTEEKELTKYFKALSHHSNERTDENHNNRTDGG
jgi:hypothetical protein